MDEMTFLRKNTKDITAKELDYITDNIHNILTHRKGRKLFKRYLLVKSFDDSTFKFHSQCLNLYNICLAIEKYISKHPNFIRFTPEELIDLFSEVRIVQKLIDSLKLETLYSLRINELSNITTEEIHDILQDIFCIEKKCQILLHNEHNSFINDILELACIMAPALVSKKQVSN